MELCQLTSNYLNIRQIGNRLPIAQVMTSLCVSKEPFTCFSKVESKHPPKVTFPGLPPYAECIRYQLCRHETNGVEGKIPPRVDKYVIVLKGDDKSWTRFVLAETLRMKKIPYADYFEIESRWVFTRDGNKFCHAEASFNARFI